MEETIGLADLNRTVSALVTMAAAVLVVWRAEVRHHHRVPRRYLQQARKTAQVLTAAAIAFLFWLAVPSRAWWLLPVGLATTVTFIVCYVLNLRFDLTIKRGDQAHVFGYATTLMAYIASGSVTVVVAGLFLLVGDRDRQPASLPVRDISVTFTGTRAADAARPVTFRVSSSAITVGCDQQRTATAAWDIPPGATISGTPEAEWVNLRRARAVEATAEIERRRVVARGRLRGPESGRLRLPWGNAPGNCLQPGSGELTLSGRYLARAPGTEPFTAELQNHIEGNGGSISLTVPSGDGLSVTQARIRVAAEGRVLDEATVGLASAATATSPKSVFTARAKGGTLLITLINGAQ